MKGRNIRDDRGARRLMMTHLAANRIERKQRLSRSMVTAAVWSSMTDEEREKARRGGIAAMWAGGFYLLLMLTATALKDTPVWVQILLTMAMLTAGPIVMIGSLVTAGKRRRRRPMAFLKQYQLCACCGYSLVGLMPEPDGCIVCSECGAAWDLERHTPPTDRRLRRVGWMNLRRDHRGRRISVDGRRDPAAPIRVRAMLDQALVLPTLDGHQKAVFGTVGGIALAATILFLTTCTHFAGEVRTGIAFGVVAVILLARPMVARRTLLAGGWCPVCLSPIGDVTPEADGCTGCPVCGHAWRIAARIGDPPTIAS